MMMDSSLLLGGSKVMTSYFALFVIVVSQYHILALRI